MKRIVVTGADGFIGRNLLQRLSELPRFEALPLNRGSTAAEWREALRTADAVVHLAGINRPASDAAFGENADLAAFLIGLLAESDRPIPVIFSSSVKADEVTPYGVSKKRAEDLFLRHGRDTGAPVAISRLPNVFGKWCRPNYNSVVATFCFNIARGLAIDLTDPDALLTLLYIDDLIQSWVDLLDNGGFAGFHVAGPRYESSVGEIAAILRGFREDQRSNRIGEVGAGLRRALYATYLSYLPPDQFAYPIVSHTDARGAFSEVLKTHASGQFSYFNALPGVTRGGHYHHTKNEKFLIVHGEALFRFRHLATGETLELRTSHRAPMVVQTIPGWVHDVTNIGQDVMVSLLWANEIFDPDHPDTIAASIV